MTAGLLALALAAAPPPATGLQKGDEFTFVGTVAEGVSRAPVFFRRNHSLELRVFVLERAENWADVAVLTRLARNEDAVGGAVGAVTGSAAEKNAPPLVRLDLARVYADGTVHLLVPEGPPPLKLTADTPARTPPPVPLDTFAPAEFGVFPPRVPRDDTGEAWTVDGAAGRPTETWQAKDFDFVNAERCRKLLMNQASPNWAKPVGGQTAWQRADAVWVSTQDGTARRVHRVIRHRDGLAEAPAAWVEVKYELKDQGRLGGRAFERARRDVEVAYSALTDAARLAPDAARLGERLFETKLARLDAQMGDTDPTSPYREAMLAAHRAFDDARRGKVVAPVQPAAGLAPATVPQRPKWPEVGQTAPEITAGSFRLSEHRGKPVVLVFLRPGGETARLALAVAGAVENRYAGRLLVVPLVVFGEMDTARAECARQKLTLPLHDGSTAVSAYGIETAPRFVLIDAAGKVRWTFTGVGAETGFLLREEADRLAPPASPAGAGGTTPAPAPALPPIVPRP